MNYKKGIKDPNLERFASTKGKGRYFGSNGLNGNNSPFSQMQQQQQQQQQMNMQPNDTRNIYNNPYNPNQQPQSQQQQQQQQLQQHLRSQQQQHVFKSIAGNLAVSSNQYAEYGTDEEHQQSLGATEAENSFLSINKGKMRDDSFQSE